MRDIEISIVTSRKASTVKRVKVSWKALCLALKRPRVDTHTLDEYLALSRDEQVELKDVGGYVGGVFSGNKRKRTELVGRDLLTFDLDGLTEEALPIVKERLESLGVAALVHSTRKHTDTAPRLRLIMPLDRTVTGEEYEAIARIVAGKIGIEYFDPTTFQPSRLMFKPSVCKDQVYFYGVLEGSPLNADKTLLKVPNWKDFGSLPHHSSESEKSQISANKQQDPTEKDGLIGAFCRAYTIYDVLDELIPDVYEATNDPNRFTYREGSTIGGAVVYDDGKFIYSNHATDPAGGKLLNAFDLVRIHKFGDLDKNTRADTHTENLPSYKAMMEFAGHDVKVKELQSHEAFEESGGVYAQDESDKQWLTELKLKKDGTCAGTINNVVLILENDSNFKGKIKYNEFSNQAVITDAMPWDRKVMGDSRCWGDVDDENLVNYIELYYAITNRRACESAFTIVSHRHTFNPVMDYLEALKWDGKPRIATIFTDCLGVEDSEYTQAVARVCMVGAVSRAIGDGEKYDYMPILAGSQGIGKSTFLAVLGGEWFTDSLSTFDSRVGAELIQGKWIAEVGELAAMNKHESAVIKQFLTRTHDRYRIAYGKRAEDFKRRCVFFGTSNEDEFLKDLTGNRRFLPLKCEEVAPSRDIWEDLPGERDQIWAEAVELYKAGAAQHLTKDEEKLAEEVRGAFTETPITAGMIEEFVKSPVPRNWNDLDLQARKLYHATKGNQSSEDLVKREYASAIEIWVECLGGDIKKFTKKDAKDINYVLKKLSCGRTYRRSKVYGRQRVWRMLTPRS